MHAHIVLAHPEPKSYNAHLAETARMQLEHDGWTVSVSDLYELGFDPCERCEHYRPPLRAERFDVQSEQRHASAEGSIPKDVATEVELLERADLLILQYPMWWHLPPAMLKGWIDRVFLYGEVYTGAMRFESGRFTGKAAMLSVTVGTSRETYDYNGRSGDINLMLWPVNFSLAFIGYTVLEPFIAYGVEAGLRYSADEIVEARLRWVEGDLKARLADIDSSAAIPFNSMSHWGADGHILPDAPSYSAFVRHREALDLG